MDVLVGGQVDGKLHEVGPNGQCGLGAGEPNVAVVVVANPGYGEQIRGESCKPAVVGGARLACRGRSKPTAAHLGVRTIVYHALHQADHQVGHSRVEHMAFGVGDLPHDVVTAILDLRNETGRYVVAVVGKDGVSSGDLERCGHVSAQRQSRGGQHVVIETGIHGQLLHLVIAHRFSQVYRGHVQGVSQGLAHRNLAVVLLLVIAGIIGLAIEHKRRGRIVENRSGSDKRLRAVDAGVEGGGVDERLKRRAGLPPGQHVIQLAHPVVAPAYQRPDLSRVRIKGHERYLGLVGIGGRLVFSSSQLGDGAVHLLHA